MSFTCQLCHSVLRTKTQYHRHLNIVHAQQSNFKVTCYRPHCSKQFKTLNAYYSHLSRTCKVQKHAPSKIWECKLCHRKFLNLRLLVKHLKNYCSVGKEMACPFNNCNKTYTKYTSLTAHISRYHRKYRIYANKGENDAPLQILQFENDIHEKSDTDIDCDLESLYTNREENNEELWEDEQIKFVGAFLLKLQSKYNIPVEAIQEIVSGMRDFMEIRFKCLNIKLQKIMFQNSFSMNLIENIQNEVIKYCNSSCLTSTFKTPYLRMEHFKTLGYVEPQEIILGRNKSRRLCSYQYVSIKESLKCLLSHRDVLNHVLNPRTSRHSGVIKDFTDGALYKNNKLLNAEKTVSLIFYFDEFELVNPIGAHRKIHKMAAFYFILGNIYPEFRSSLKCIQLAIMCRALDLKEFGLKKILEPLILEMQDLSKNSLDVPGIGSFYCGIYCVAGDNLGSNSIGGYLECFRGSESSICRTCLATGSECKHILHEDLCILRSVSTYDRSVSHLDTDSLVSCEGIKFDSPLNDLPSFHVQTGLPPDIMHDLFEGIVPYEIKLVLLRLQSNGYITIEGLNRRILHYGLKNSAKENRPMQQPRDLKSVVGTAAEKWSLLRLLPILIGELIPEGNEEWEVLLHLKCLTERIVCESFTTGLIHILQDLIRDHLELVLRVFPEAGLKPKHHFMIHYPRHIYNFGPLIRYWCFRFEAKHFMFKEIIRQAKQFRNPCKTLSIRHQLRQCFEHQAPEFLHFEIDYSASDVCDPNFIEPEAKKVFTSVPACIPELFSCQSVFINGTLYKKELFLGVNFQNGDPVWGAIKYILTNGETVFFVLLLHDSEYLHHYGAFALKPNGKYCYKNFNDLADWYPLTSYQLSLDKFVIVMRHYLYDETEFV